MEHTKEELNNLIDELFIDDALYIMRKFNDKFVWSNNCQMGYDNACEYFSLCICQCHLNDNKST